MKKRIFFELLHNARWLKSKSWGIMYRRVYMLGMIAAFLVAEDIERY